MFKKKIKNHKDKKYLLGYLVRGSVTSLKRYVSTHPEGETFARNEIIKMKYDFNSCSIVIRNLVCNMINHPDLFSFKYESPFVNQEPGEYKAFSYDLNLCIMCYDDDSGEILIGYTDTVLSNKKIEKIFVLNGIIAAMHIKDNIDRYEIERKNHEEKQRLIEHFS